MEGRVIKGFGRGSKELGIPTANLTVDNKLTLWISTIKPGAYFGWVSLSLNTSQPTILSYTTTSTSTTAATKTRSKFGVYPMVMSIGHNLSYGNEDLSAEVHVLHESGADF